ncbi:hypothetical protein [Kitasatospora paranensis]|uniref:hypothetical protein n=1 Tax=Kitasatospora paranensis TaxID=258053 RepID=UPI0031E5FDF5
MGDLVRTLGGDGDGEGWPPGSALRVVAVDYRNGRRVVFGDQGRRRPRWRRR